MYKSFKEMEIWNMSMDIAVEVFKITSRLPAKEDFALTSQLRRSSLSISGNIAEAFGRGYSLDKINFYYYSRGSLTETQSYIEYGRKVGYFSENEIKLLNDKLESILLGLNKIIVSLTKNKKIKKSFTISHS
ncbi:MAG: four helix bundle protein [Elusimicrobia bacterium]|jgi:four helix bundle protein|nr:four helix bundle protein [Elusimicrobiota bacterium]